MAKTRKKVGVLASGRGSNLQALLDAALQEDYPAEISLVISNRPGAYALERAKKAGVATLALDHKDFTERTAFDNLMTEALEAAGIEIVVLAGYMRLLSLSFIQHWHNRLINIHPSLLPLFPGLNTHQRAIETGVKFHGCSVHMVRHEVDTGPIIGQAVVPVLPDDTADSLAARVLHYEHKLYPHCVALLASGLLEIGDEWARTKNPTQPSIADGQDSSSPVGLMNPAPCEGGFKD